jgi:dTDP-glucose pyrophosphorylase
MLQIVVPMAGSGTRFREAGYERPKPLISVAGVPMIRLVIENLRPAVPHRFTFVCQKVHLDSFDLARDLTKWAPGSNVISIPSVSEGAACTVLAAKRFIDSSSPLMIANSDQFITTDINAYLGRLEHERLDGLIMTMSASDPKWSFVELNSNRAVLRVVEKEVISNEATVGIYNFRRGRDFVSAAEAMLRKNIRVNGEFYVAPVYNELIAWRKKIGIVNIGSVENEMHGLGTPADLERFLTLPIAKKMALRFK